MGLLVELFTRLFSLVHPRYADPIARPLAGLLWHASGRLRKVSLKNLELCFPNMETVERTALARQSMYHYVRNALEAGITWHWPRERIQALALPAEGKSHFESARESGRGVILLLPHFGSWELIAPYLAHEITGGILYKPGRHPGVEARLRKKRERFGLSMVPASRSGLKALYHALGESRVVCILPDQEPRLGEGRFAPFYGIPALTGVLVPRLLAATGARAVFIACERCNGGRYRIHYLPADRAIHCADMDTALAALNRGVERCISIQPAQYLWAYKRFRARPEGQESFYQPAGEQP